MRLGKALKIILIVVPLLVVALVVGAIAVLMTTDFNKYKPLIAEQAKEATGRDLVIAGDLEIGISLTPSVSVAGVTLSNAKWGKRPEMIKVERFEAQMSLIPLAFGIIDVQRIVLVGADILLEVDKKGRANFDFKAPGAKEEPAAPAEQPVEAEEDGALPIPVVREVVIRDSRLTYTDAKAGASHEASIDELTINGEGPENPIEMLFKGSYNKADIKMTASLGAPIELIAPTKPYPVALTLEAGGANISVKGTIAEPMAGKGLNLAVSVTGSQLGDLSAVAGAEVPKLGAYSMSTSVTGDPATALNLVGFKGELAGSDVSGDVTVNLKGKRPFIDAKLKSKLIDVTALGGAAGGAAPTGDEKQPAKPGDRMFPDDPLPVEGLRAVDAKLVFDADMILAAGAK
ncbi:MAG: AsmA family protein, partial [Proteobacteria bacterium]|nr:AsmA family protein [Pseudomonadota bacterium]